MKGFSLIILFSLLINIAGYSQEDDPIINEPKLFADFLMGPYLFIDHIQYDAVMLFGSRLGYDISNSFSFIVEYVVGQQEDEFGTLGMTHHASIHSSFYLLSKEKKITPYIYAGGGFLEFKAFTKDKYGIGLYGGSGIENNLRELLKSFIEFRYLNISSFGWSAKHEIGVFWGIRLKF